VLAVKKGKKKTCRKLYMSKRKETAWMKNFSLHGNEEREREREMSYGGIQMRESS
jgi:hypothetical protein